MLRHPTHPERHLRRILRVAQDMKELVALLLVLAKDPERLHATSEVVNIHQLLPVIVYDHLFLAERKELAFELENDSPLVVHAPAQIVRATIGNLIRNAIENSERGIVRIATTPASQVIITDPGHGMSEEELTHLYSRMARSGMVTHGSGIGLDLIQRICRHFGWTIEFSSRPKRGTCVVLDFKARPA